MNPLPPGPRGLDAVRAALALRSLSADVYLDLFRRFGDVVHLGVPFPMTFVYHPDGLAHVFLENHHNYIKSRLYSEVRPVMGEGVATSDGAVWQRERRMLAPEFRRSAVQRFFATMRAQTRRMLEAWEGRLTPCDMSREMIDLTLRTAGETLFGSDVEPLVASVAEAIDEYTDVAARRTLSAVKIPRWIPTPANRRMQRALRKLEAAVAAILERHRRDPPPGVTVMSRLLAATADDPPAVAARRIRDEALTMLVAGHETTCNTLLWTLCLLAQHPEVEQRAADEVAAVLRGREPEYDDVARLTYVTQVVQEAMRLYPALPVVSREAVADDVIQGHAVRRGTTVLAPVYVTHRHPHFWPAAETFDPDRFAPSRPALTHRSAYLPFLVGPRNCIGADYAMVQMPTIVAMILQRFRLHLLDPSVLIPRLAMSLQPAGPVWMQLEPRPTAESGFLAGPCAAGVH